MSATEHVAGGPAGDQQEPLAPSARRGCCASPSAEKEIPKEPGAAVSPCCGTSEQAVAEGSCCGISAKAEAVAAGAGCCG